MPITFRIHPERNLIQARFEGLITVDDLREYNLGLRQDPLFHTRMRELVVLASIRPNLSSDDIFVYKQWFNTLQPVQLSAIVASTDFEFGMARMFAQMSPDSASKIRVFRDEPAARTWLEAPPDLA